MSSESEKLYIDRETTSMLIEVLEGEFFDLIKEYMAAASRQIAELKGTSPEDKDGMISLVHIIKGSSGNVGASYLSSICNDLETGLRMNEITDPDPYINKIDETFKGTCILLEKLIQEVA